MKIQMHSTMAQIGLENKKSVQTIRQPKGDLNIKQEKPEMIVDREIPHVIIDQSQCFAEVGLKRVTDVFKECAELGQQALFEEIGRIAQEGDRLARIEEGIDLRSLLADMAEERAWHSVDINIDIAPKSRPNIEVQGHLKVDWKLGGALIDYKPNKAITRYQPGDVNIYIKRWNKLDINVVDEKV